MVPLRNARRFLAKARLNKTMANKVSGFVKDVKVEMSKVAWPTKDELIGSTVIVLVSLALLSAFIGLCDLVLSNIVNIIMARL